jgi:phosphoribosylamine--glycine ligase
VHNDQLVTSGGRVLTLVARGASLSHARAQVLDAVPIVRFEGVQYRRDIGLEAVYA